MTPAARRRLLLTCCVPLVAAAAAGCGGEVRGTAGSAEQTAVTGSVGTPLAELVPAPAAFPSGYPAVVLSAEAAVQAAGDLDGVGPGATVDPARCAPPPSQPDPRATAVAVGTDEGTRASLTVELTRTDQPLARLRTRLAECPSIRVARAGAGATVTTELRADVPSGEPAPDDALALDRTVTPDRGGAGLTQTMRTLVGQVDDVRITVTGMVFGGSDPDPDAVAELFGTAVRQVREG